MLKTLTFALFLSIVGLVSPVAAEAPVPEAPQAQACQTFTAAQLITAAGIQGHPRPIDLKGDAYKKFVDAFEAATRPGNRPPSGDEVVLVHTPGVGWMVFILQNDCATMSAQVAEATISKVLDQLASDLPSS